MGWRYLQITLGAICLVMALVRLFVLRTTESPRWLICQGRNAEAVTVLHTISRKNKSAVSVSLDQFIPLEISDSSEKRSVRESTERAKRLFVGKAQLRLMLSLGGIWMLVGIA